MITGVIYISTARKTNKSYIGQTIQYLEERKSNHKYKTNNDDNNHFHNAIKKYGWDNFEWSILYDNIPQDQLRNMEIWCIANYDTYHNGYNSTEGGDENPMNNPESRKKVSQANKGENHPNFGKHRSEETKRK